MKPLQKPTGVTTNQTCLGKNVLRSRGGSSCGMMHGAMFYVTTYVNGDRVSLKLEFIYQR